MDLDEAATLLEILQNSKSELTKAMFDCIDVKMIKDIIENIDKSFEKKTKGNESPFFWIKKGKDELLDITRKTYDEHITVFIYINSRNCAL